MFSDPRLLSGALAWYHDFKREPAARLPQPALIVGGTTDIVPVEAFRGTPEAFEGPCEVLICEGAGHWPHREAAEVFNERLVGWLKALPAG